MRYEEVLLALCATIIGVLSLENQPVERPEFTREQEFQTHVGASVVQSDVGSLFIVTLNNRTIDVKSTDSSIESCEGIPIDPFEDTIEGEVRARIPDTLKKRMIIWGVHGSKIIKNNSSRIVYYTMLLIDLEKCQSAALLLPEDQYSLYQQTFLPEISFALYSQNVFDVHFASQQYCSPCTFDASSSTPRQPDMGPLKAEGAQPASDIHLQPLYPVDDFTGFFYAFNFIDDTAVVKLLNYRYEVRALRYLKHSVDVVSVRNAIFGRIRNVGYCYKALDALNKVYCERLDSRLQSVIGVMLPLDQPAKNVSLEYDEEGNFFVAVVLADDIRVFVYDLFGELLATLDFGQLQDNDNVRDLKAHSQDNQYCLFYSIEQEAHNANNIVKCIDARKYIQSY